MASPSAFSQVIFNDISKTYFMSAPVTCHYTLAVGFEPTTRDWVGIFKVGWSTTKDYSSFVWVDPPVDLVTQEPMRKQSLFGESYLPKEESEFYQFCYVDCAGHVRGASTAFSFQHPVENMDCSMESDLLVVTTQDEVERSARQTEELRAAVEQLRTQGWVLEKALEEKQREVDDLKEQNKEKNRKASDLAEELNRARRQSESTALFLKQKEQEAERLMEQISIQTQHHLDRDQHNATEKEPPEINTASGAESGEKYEWAVIQIEQLKVELEQQKLHHTQSADIAELRTKIKGEFKEELIRLKDAIQLLEVDLKHSEREREMLSAELEQLKLLALEVDTLKTENRALRESLSQQEAQASRPDQDYKAQCSTLSGQLEHTQTLLALQSVECKDRSRRAEDAERELLDTKEQLQLKDAENDLIMRDSSQLKRRLAEFQEVIAEKDAEIAEVHEVIALRENRLEIQNQVTERLERRQQEIIAEKDAELAARLEVVALRENRLKIQNQEKEELLRENQHLRANVEELCRACGQEQNTLPKVTGRGGRDLDAKGKSPMCRYCQVPLPGVTPEELEQHEQSHRVCPFCTLICDDMALAQFEDHVYSHEM